MSPTLFTAVCAAERVSATKNDHHSKNAANISTGTLRKHNSDAAHQFRLWSSLRSDQTDLRLDHVVQ